MVSDQKIALRKVASELHQQVLLSLSYSRVKEKINLSFQAEMIEKHVQSKLSGWDSQPKRDNLNNLFIWSSHKPCLITVLGSIRCYC